MLDNTIDLAYAGATVSMTRVNQDSFGSTYYGENGTDKLSMIIRHTIPPRGAAGESHMLRLDVEHYDAQGIFLRTSSAWTVLKTFDGSQDSTSVSAAGLAVATVTDQGFLDRLAARES